MFIYSMHANTIKFFAVICLALTALIALITFAPTYTDGSTPVGTQVTYNFEKIKSNDAPYSPQYSLVWIRIPL